MQQLRAEEEAELSELDGKFQAMERNELVKVLKEYLRNTVYPRFPSNSSQQQPLKLKVYGSDFSGVQLNREDTSISRGAASVLEALCVLSRYALPGWGFRLLNDDVREKRMGKLFVTITQQQCFTF